MEERMPYPEVSAQTDHREEAVRLGGVIAAHTSILSYVLRCSDKIRLMQREIDRLNEINQALRNRLDERPAVPSTGRDPITLDEYIAWLESELAGAYTARDKSTPQAAQAGQAGQAEEVA